jgi:hypothetical protein
VDKKIMAITEERLRIGFFLNIDLRMAAPELAPALLD